MIGKCRYMREVGEEHSDMLYLDYNQKNCNCGDGV